MIPCLIEDSDDDELVLRQFDIKRAAAAAALPVSAPSEPASNQFNRLKSNKQEVVVIPASPSPSLSPMIVNKTVQRRKVTILDSDDEDAASEPAAKPVAAAAGFPTAGKRKAQSSSSSSSSSSDSDSDSDSSSSSSSDDEALAVKQVKLKEGGVRDGGGKWDKRNERTERTERTERKERRLAAGENGFANGHAVKAARKEAWRKRVGPAGVARAESTVIELSDNDNDGETAEHAIEVNSAAEEEDEADEYEDEERGPDRALERCEALSHKLARLLGKPSTSGDCFDQTEADGRHQVLTAHDVWQACGGAQNTPRLKSYQVVGVNFLSLLHEQGLGAILADEMGLGKTAQVIAFLAVLSAKANRPALPHIIIVPASLLENWQRELRMWCPALRVVLFHGNAREWEAERLRPWGRGGAKAGQPPPFDVMLCCYTLFERESSQAQEDRNFLKYFEWSHLILDEAHLVKNAASARSKKIRIMAKRAQRRLLLTGTPLQNNLAELANLLQFIMPDLIEDQAAMDEFTDASPDDEGAQAALIKRVKALLGPFVLRRIKSQVMRELPTKTEHVAMVAMEAKQRELYHATLQRVKGELRAGAGGSGGSKRKNANAKKINNIFTELRKICNHPALTRWHYDDAALSALANVALGRGTFGPDAGLERVKEELETMSDFELHNLWKEYGPKHANHLLSREQLLGSGKFTALTALLTELKAKGSKPLIFSQWTTILDIIEWLMHDLGLAYCRLDGSTPVEERQTLVDQFNDADSPIFAFLLTTRAGGQGLNLVGADTVILHDIDFNPQIDRQAEDRAHRIGQTRPVAIHRLVTDASVDENVYNIALRKKSLDNAVLDDEGMAAKEETTAIRDIISNLLDVNK